MDQTATPNYKNGSKMPEIYHCFIDSPDPFSIHNPNYQQQLAQMQAMKKSKARRPFDEIIPCSNNVHTPIGPKQKVLPLQTPDNSNELSNKPKAKPSYARRVSFSDTPVKNGGGYRTPRATDPDDHYLSLIETIHSPIEMVKDEDKCDVMTPMRVRPTTSTAEDKGSGSGMSSEDSTKSRRRLRDKLQSAIELDKNLPIDLIAESKDVYVQPRDKENKDNAAMAKSSELDADNETASPKDSPMAADAKPIAPPSGPPGRPTFSRKYSAKTLR